MVKVELHAPLDAQSEAALDLLQEQLAAVFFRVRPETLALDAFRDGELEDPIVLTYLGTGQLSDEPFFPEFGSVEEEPAEIPVDDPDFVQWDVLRTDTLDEFRVTIPRSFLADTLEVGQAEGLHLGSAGLEGQARETPAFRGWSTGVDNRVIQGTYNVAHTDAAFEKHVVFRILDPMTEEIFPGCTGALFGVRHIATAAHCIRNTLDAQWIGQTFAYAGRSGNEFRYSLGVSGMYSTYLWVPTMFKTLTDFQTNMPFTAQPYDIGFIVTWDFAPGNEVGWFGFWGYDDDQDFLNDVPDKFHAGYTACDGDGGFSIPHEPANCSMSPFALWGQNDPCGFGTFENPDPDGINRTYWTSCDTSKATSGSPLHGSGNNTGPLIFGVWGWEACSTCGATHTHPNAGVRLTKEYGGQMVLLLELGLWM